MLKYSFLFTFLLSVILVSETQAQREFEIEEDGVTYHMKEYFVVFLKKGPNREKIDPKVAEELQTKHLKYLGNLYTEGKIVLNGPFGDDGELRGMSFYSVESLEEAERLATGDPMVKAGWLAVEVHPWFGAKGSTLK